MVEDKLCFHQTCHHTGCWIEYQTKSLTEFYDLKKNGYIGDNEKRFVTQIRNNADHYMFLSEHPHPHIHEG